MVWCGVQVTLVSNLEAYGLSPGALAREAQRGAAAAGGVTRSAAAKHDQLMVQGDQVIAFTLISKTT